MAKRKAARDDETKLFWFLVANYIGSVVGLLDETREEKLQSLAEDWKDKARGELGVTDTFVRSVYALCTEWKSPAQALGFILRGFGCPDADERAGEILG